MKAGSSPTVTLPSSTCVVPLLPSFLPFIRNAADGGTLPTRFFFQGADYHNYQPGWTLVGSGLAQKEDLRRPLPSLIPSHLHLHSSNAASFSPSSNSLTLASGSKLTYDFLIVCPGLQTNFGAIKGLPEALEMGTKESGVGTIYSYKNCDSVWDAIQDFGGKKAIFTQPKGIIKCAGAPQKLMWMARSQWERDGKVDKIGVEFVSGMVRPPPFPPPPCFLSQEPPP